MTSWIIETNTVAVRGAEYERNVLNFQLYADSTSWSRSSLLQYDLRHENI